MGRGAVGRRLRRVRGCAKAAQGSVLDVETGTRFREEILEVGGSRPAIESFKAFRGREPTIDALLRHSGMAQAPLQAADTAERMRKKGVSGRV